jgi:hypothetical protein
MTEVEDEYTRNLKYNAFMGTIAVCVIYGIIAILMILYINLTESGKALYDDLKPFALTFIFGTLFIIISITIMVLYWRPEQAKKLEIQDVLQNPYSCPDYYKLEKIIDTDSNMLSNMSSILDINKKYKLNKDVDLKNYRYTQALDYKCVFDDTVIEKASIEANSDAAMGTGTNGLYNTSLPDANFNLLDDSTTDFTDEDSKLLKLHNKEGYAAFAMMYGGITGSNLKPALPLNSETADKFQVDCRKVYPKYLAQLDAQYYIDNNESGDKNKHRCEWSKRCGVPWGSAGCS